MNDNFIKEWVKRAEKEENGSLFQFVSYYIALNHIYNGFECDSGKKRSEICLLKKCIKQITSTYKYNPYKELSAESELLKGVRSEKLNKETSIIKLKNKDIEELFTSIYYIRCNLFHGSKSMYNERNNKLVKDSCRVLRTLFAALNDK